MLDNYHTNPKIRLRRALDYDTLNQASQLENMINEINLLDPFVRAAIKKRKDQYLESQLPIIKNVYNAYIKAMEDYKNANE